MFTICLKSLWQIVWGFGFGVDSYITFPSYSIEQRWVTLRQGQFMNQVEQLHAHSGCPPTPKPFWDKSLPDQSMSYHFFHCTLANYHSTAQCSSKLVNNWAPSIYRKPSKEHTPSFQVELHFQEVSRNMIQFGKRNVFSLYVLF